LLLLDSDDVELELLRLLRLLRLELLRLLRLDNDELELTELRLLLEEDDSLDKEEELLDNDDELLLSDELEELTELDELNELELKLDELDDESVPGSGKSGGDGPRTAPLPVPLQLAKLGKFAGTMPDLRGHSLRSAMLAMDGCDCAVDIDGNGYVIEQAPEPGIAVAADGRVALTLARASAP